MHTNRLDNPAAEAALAADFFTATPKLTPNQRNQDPGERSEAVVRQPSRRPGAPLGLASLDLVFGGTALAADLITASKSFAKNKNMHGFGPWGANPCMHTVTQRPENPSKSKQ